MKNSNAIIHILVVDDDEEDFFITSHLIQQIRGLRIAIDWCPGYENALTKMLNSEYDIYFIDYILKTKNGLDLIREAIANDCQEPMVLLTGKGNYSVDVEGMRAGAFDYLEKADLGPDKIERSIRYSLEKSAALKALRSNEKKFRNFFEKSRDAVFFADEHLCLKDVNTGTEEFFEYSRQELKQFCLPDLVYGKRDREFLLSSIHLADEINDLELDFLTKSGKRRPCILSITRSSESEHSLAFQGIIHDITNLRVAEKANLQVEKMASSGRLIRLLAHEIRNPLTNIYLSTDEISQMAGPDAAPYIDIINRNTKTINNLLIELVNSSNPVAPRLSRISLEEVMDLAIIKAADRMNLKGIELNTQYPADPSWIEADSEKLNIAFLNIILNSIEAFRQGNGKINITIRPQGAQHEVIIEDNGCGISDENINKLFEPYFTSKRNGLGLGLASTLNIVNSHEGTINVHSREGMGTKFVVHFKKADTPLDKATNDEGTEKAGMKI